MAGTARATPPFMLPRNTMSVGSAVEGKPIRVWLVDDSKNFRILLGTLLEEEGGFECSRQFACAEDLLDVLVHEAPDVILLDVRMPGMGGIAAVAPIKALAPATHVLMLTTFGDSQAKAQALEDGASNFLLKSFPLPEIAQHIRNAHAGPCILPKAEKFETLRAETMRRDLGGCASASMVRGVGVFRSLLGNLMGKSERARVAKQFIEW